jgi:inner membrane protein YidH
MFSSEEIENMSTARKPFDEPRERRLDSGTELALKRTLLAHERTLMAWIRTSASLISFGFTIYKFFEYFAEARAVSPAPHLFGPRHFGMGMIVVGVFALVLAIIDYGREMNVLQAEYGPIRRPAVGKIASLVSILGVGLFLILWLNV